MIYKIGNDHYNVAADVLIELFESTNVPSDPELLKEEVGLICIENRKKDNWVEVDGQSFKYTTAYKKFFPDIDLNIIKIARKYWSSELLNNGKIEWLIDYLINFPFSKRAILQLWKDDYSDLSKSSSCITSIFFRIKNDKLEMHSSVRANNAASLMFLDISFMLAVQDHVAARLSIQSGDYYHFMNSLHLYRDEEERIGNIYKYLKTKYAK